MTNRMINTRVWSDNWFSLLDPIEKLLFLYFITNTYNNISGVYELPMKVAAVETGIDPSMFAKILPRLEPKVLYHDGWVILPNLPKHQNISSKDVVLGIQREFALAPAHVQQAALGGGWGDGLGTASDTKPNLTNTKLISEAPLRIESTLKEKTDTKYREVFELWGDYPLQWRKNRTEIEAAKNLLIESSIEDMKWLLGLYEKYKKDPFCPTILKPSDMDRKWDNLLAFKKKHEQKTR